MRDSRVAAHIRKLRRVFVHRKYASPSLLRHETRELRVGADAPRERPFFLTRAHGWWDASTSDF